LKEHAQPSRSLAGLPTVSIVMPCYNEEAVLPEAARQVSALLDHLESVGLVAEGYISFVDDGSDDTTWELMKGWRLRIPVSAE
jgi:glycosyltransferase involved in cell wall biosynthesis